MKKIVAILSFLSAITLFADIENGKVVYAQNCANCHSVSMTGGMGKDFNLVSYNRKKEDVIKYIVSPMTMYREFGYSANAMPRFPLSGEDVEDVAEYIDSLQRFKVWMKKGE